MKFDIYEKLPDNWVVVDGTNTNPIGCVFISNNKTRFGKDRKLALLKIN